MLFFQLLKFKWASLVVLMVKNPPANAGDIRDVGSVPESGRSPGERHRNPLQYSCLEDPTDRGAWRATVHRAAKSQTRRKRLGAHTHPDTEKIKDLACAQTHGLRKQGTVSANLLLRGVRVSGDVRGSCYL